MAAAPTIAELRALSDQEVVERYDSNAGHTTVGVGFYLDELARRDAHRQGERIVRLTWVISLATLASLAFIAYQVIHG